MFAATTRGRPVTTTAERHAEATGDRWSGVDDTMVRLSDGEFAQLAALVYQRFGISLTDKKKALVRGRLNSLLKAQGNSSFSEYLAAVRADPTGDALTALIDRISTNHSFFFREPSHFEFLTQEILPALCGEKGIAPGDLRLWSAGCAAGEEPYTLAMLLHDHFGGSVGRSGPLVLATDVSMRALQQAAAGAYPEQRVEHVPERYRKYLRKTSAQTYEVVEPIRQLVLFKRLNLMGEDFPFRGLFDLTFCRNVMIYFDQPTRAALVARFHRYLKTGGYLFIGHSETLGRDSPLFRYVRPTVYLK
jgi:chemotaxis protein methyltransferase CheR